MTLSYRNVKNSASKNYTTYDFPSQLPLQDVVEGTLSFVKSVTSLYVYNNGWQPIQIANEAPAIDSAPPPSVFIPIGGNFSFDLAATDPDGLPISWSYEVVSGSTSVNTLNLSQNTFSFSALDDTLFTVRFKASDTVNEVTSDTIFTITNEPPSDPVLLSNGNNFAGYSPINSVQNYQFTSVDPEGANIIWSATAPDQDNIVNSAMTGDTLSVIMNEDTTTAVFDITASDGKYSTTNTFQLSPTLPRWNWPVNASYSAVIDKPNPTNTDSFQEFGRYIDVYKDRMITSIWNSDDNPDVTFGDRIGEVYIYKINESTDAVTVEQKLVSPNLSQGSEFGRSLVINDDVAFVGNPGWDGDPNVPYPGAVEIWSRTNTTWTYVGLIESPAPGDIDKFGHTMSFDRTNSQLAISEIQTNKVHIYDVDGTTVTYSATILGSTAVYPGTSQQISGVGFGESLAFDRGRIAIASRTRYNTDGTNANPTGIAPVVCIFDYNENTSTWDFTDYLFEDSDDGRLDTEFGFGGNAISLYRDSLIIGAFNFNEYGTTGLGEGAAFFYELINGVWTKTHTITGKDIYDFGNQQMLGHAVMQFNDTAIITMKTTDGNNKPGAVKVIRSGGYTWATNITNTMEFNLNNVDTDTGTEAYGGAMWYDKIFVSYEIFNTGTIRYFKAFNT